ncbi:MAG: hypothetical protein ACOY4K_00570 [Pseudomonadota bacterium]
MPIIPLSAQAYGRTGLPVARLVNLYVERTPEGPTESVRRGRPGLVAGDTVGFGPVRAIVTHAGYRFVVSGTRVFRNGVQVGVIPGLYRVRFAQSDTQLVMVADSSTLGSTGVAYLVGASVSTITIPNSDPVSDVGFLGGRFIYTIQGSGTYRYSDVGDAETIGALNFATAESDPDETVSLEILGDNALFFGQTTTEWWGTTSDAAAPFQRYAGRRYDVGSAAQNSAVKMDNGIFFVGTAQRSDRTDLKVYRTGAVAEVVSTPAIDALMAQCADISTATAIEVPVEGRSFYVLNIPGVTTVAFDVREKTWAEWSSYGETVFRLQCSDAGVYGDNDIGQLWTLDPDATNDDGDPIIRICSAYLPSAARMRVNCLELYCSRGEGALGTTPVVEMRYTDSDDANWSTWTSAGLGAHGEHPRARWWQLGMLRPPGRIVEFRCSDDVLFAPYGLAMNETR